MTNQEKRVIGWLNEYGSINPLESWKFLGVYRLSAVIYSLKARGHVITTERMDVENQLGETCHVAKYVLVHQKEEQAVA